MRYILGLIFAAVLALGATLFVSSRVATWVVAAGTYEDPDSVANLHALVFMAVNVLALVAGWCMGWLLGMLFERPERPV